MEAPLSPELLREVTARAKKQIRQRMRALRTSYPAAALARRSELLTTRLLGEGWFDQARSVALFWPLLERGEIDLRPVDQALRARGVAIYYPFMDPTASGFRTGFRLSGSAEELILRGGKFAEPPRDAPEAARGDVDVVVVPALAADGRGHRIGYGAGYYDATLGDLAPPATTVIVAYDFQLLAEIPAEPHDVPCARVVTDERSLLIG